MAYETQKRKEFLESLKEIKINRPIEEDLIKDFTPIGLSDLYELLIKSRNIPGKCWFTIFFRRSCSSSDILIGFLCWIVWR